MTAVMDDWGYDEVAEWRLRKPRQRRPSGRAYGWSQEQAHEPPQETSRRTTREPEESGLAAWIHRHDLGSRITAPTADEIERHLRGRLP